MMTIAQQFALRRGPNVVSFQRRSSPSRSSVRARLDGCQLSHPPGIYTTHDPTEPKSTSAVFDKWRTLPGPVNPRHPEIATQLDGCSYRIPDARSAVSEAVSAVLKT